MGAYEYQTEGPLYDTFTVQSRDELNNGGWIDVYTGNSCTWTDTGTTGVKKRFYRVYPK